jgi:hypothetical protein
VFFLFCRSRVLGSAVVYTMSSPVCHMSSLVLNVDSSRWRYRERRRADARRYEIHLYIYDTVSKTIRNANGNPIVHVLANTGLKPSIGTSSMSVSIFALVSSPPSHLFLLAYSFVLLSLQHSPCLLHPKLTCSIQVHLYNDAVEDVSSVMLSLAWVRVQV